MDKALFILILVEYQLPLIFLAMDQLHLREAVEEILRAIGSFLMWPGSDLFTGFAGYYFLVMHGQQRRVRLVFGFR